LKRALDIFGEGRYITTRPYGGARQPPDGIPFNGRAACRDWMGSRFLKCYGHLSRRCVDSRAGFSFLKKIRFFAKKNKKPLDIVC
jgi:hypothetical protein